MTAPRRASAFDGASPGAGFPGGGFQFDENTRYGEPVACDPASMPSGELMSKPASTALPSVMLIPSVIQPLLLNERSPSLPIRVTFERAMIAPCVPVVGLIGPGESGAGLSAAPRYEFGL